MVNYDELHPSCKKVLTYWIGDPNNPEETGYGKSKLFWWNSTPELDEEIRQEFIEDYEKARRGEYDDWKDDPYGCLGLILLLDQLPRNMFRDKVETWATDDLGLELAKLARERGYSKKFEADADDFYDRLYEKQFMMLPFAHSESLEDQALSGAITREELKREDWIGKTVIYYNIIKRFGRFPHRNELLGRISTPEELEFLRTEWMKG